MTENEVTLGEIYRSLQRLEAAFIAHQVDTRTKNHELVAKIQSLVAPMGAFDVRLSSVETRVEKLEPRVDSVVTNAAFIAGGIAAIGFLITVVWK